MDNRDDRRPASVPFKRREPKPFADLLRGATEFSKRRNRRTDKDEVQVRIGTSKRNSLAIPVKDLGTLLEIVKEIYEKSEDKVQELEDFMAKRVERNVTEAIETAHAEPEPDAQ